MERVVFYTNVSIDFLLFRNVFVFVTPSMGILTPLLRRIRVSTLWSSLLWWLDCRGQMDGSTQESLPQTRSSEIQMP